jgi:hypothetical protein
LLKMAQTSSTYLLSVKYRNVASNVAFQDVIIVA